MSKNDIAIEDKRNLLEAQIEEARKTIYRTTVEVAIAQEMIEYGHKLTNSKDDNERNLAASYVQTGQSRQYENKGIRTQMELAIKACEKLLKSL